ncbi:hypothetical protein K439DRAFT_1621006 [Ramaria rubella]|nr:hypothetical protein K439DRAFT_1621006 [Ramaria rubella]
MHDVGTHGARDEHSLSNEHRCGSEGHPVFMVLIVNHGKHTCASTIDITKILHICLTQIEDLSKKDVAGNKLTLRVVAWAPHPLKRERGQNISTGEEFDDYASVSSKQQARQTPSLQHSMRTRSHVSVHLSRACTCAKDGLGSPSGVSLTSQKKVSHPAPEMSKRYHSTYDPKVAGPSLSSLSSFVCYDVYTFLRITWTCEPSGKITLNHREVEETILVANDWAKHNYQSQPRGSYLGSGIEKYAFRGRVGETDLALFESSPINSYLVMTDDQNRKDML